MQKKNYKENKKKISESKEIIKKEKNVFSYFNENFKKLKFSYIKFSYIILIAIILFGFYLRFYHIQYPLIGYHNWKSAHYITEARNFAREGFFKNGFFVPMRDTIEKINEPLDGSHSDTFPMISVIVAIFFKLFGENIVVARLVNIFFTLASVFVFYLLLKKLFEKEEFALLGAFLFSINPMYVFFSHNIDVVNPGIFFMLLGILFYVKWIKEQLKDKKYSFLVFSALFVMLASITKYTFVVITIPMFFTFPFKEVFNQTKENKKILFYFLISAIIFSLFPIWMYYSEVYVKNNVFGKEFNQDSLESYDLVNLIDFSILWKPDFWQIMKSYVNDNYTMIGFWFSFLGSLIFVLLYFTKNRKNFSYDFMFWSLISVFVFLFVMGYKLSGHSYHQYPVGFIVIFMSAFFIEVIATNMGLIFNEYKNYAKIVVFILLVFAIPLYAKSIEAINRQFDTQFPGLDIAGDYMKEHKGNGDRMFHSTGQSFGILWHADMKGYKPPTDVEYLKKAELEKNVSWIFMYQWGLDYYFKQAEMMDYIRNNYRLVQFGFVNQGNMNQPIFLVFRKGGSFNETKLNELLQNKPVYSRKYSYSNNRFYEIRFINLE
ncbi:MAG: glycosyltransferase family 39 protein [Candidatus Woesearchaeota archaeon]